MKEMTAPVSNIQKFSVHDGPGIRTVVFFMGCPLRCQWCQNPEMFTARKRLMFLRDKCIGCQACIPVCPTKASTYADGEIHLDWNCCIGCGACAGVCVTGAREMIGAEKTVSEVEKAVLSDEVFYRQSHGGVTLSGGEATMHTEFAEELFRRLHARGIHTAVETSGYCETARFLRLAQHTDLFLYDIKHTDPELHRAYTGVGLELIQENLQLIADQGKNIVIRIPLIPGKNDSEENMLKTAQIARRVGAREIHVLPFHQMGESKWKDSGQNYMMAGMESAGEDTVNRCAEILKSSNLPVNIGGHGIYEFLKY